MALTLNGIRLPLGADESSLKALAARALDIPEGAVLRLRARRVSLDARRKNDICFEYTLEASLAPEDEARALRSGRAEPAVPRAAFEPRMGAQPLPAPVVVAGLGPAGLFAAYALAKFGYRPIVLERGKQVSERQRDVRGFWAGGALDPESNVMFGEGGAGAFSDGKLTTRIKDPLCDEVLSVLARFGAPEETVVQAKPHIGTDKLCNVVSSIRAQIERLGGEVRFGAKLAGLESRDGALEAARIATFAGEERLPLSALLLAVGQNAEDTYRMLHAAGIELAAKPYAVGVRIEHPRALIDRSQFGEHAGHPRLGAAEYRFADRSGGRGVYTFCMCPGGKVIGCANESGRVVVNGMSEHARADENSNAAVVVQVDERDFPPGPLGGLSFREKLERAAFEAGGGDYRAPASTLGAFLAKAEPYGFGSVAPSCLPGVKLANLNAVLPDFVAAGVRDGVLAFGRKLRGFDMDEAVLTALESRTSAPVRILRDELGEATRMRNLYPCGEGAGYAGGIVSAAVDGMRAAERVMARFAPLL
ncbi:MAG: mercuric reductase [Firmicutes bacterium ADurb.Bin248]|nr:MAG: mercuric reductase [Firmicutes bacterium ADurb.Bin248]HOF99484.1 hypothetical protein [Clostridia bacterium]HPK15177.1 hypothetical protein [Clostridia bacterium]